MEYMRSGRPFAVLDLGSAYVKALLVHPGPTGRWGVVGAGVVSYPRRRPAHGDFGEGHFDAASEAIRRASERATGLTGRALTPSCCLISVPAPPALLTVEVQERVRSQPSTAIDSEESLSHGESLQAAAVEAAYSRSEQQWPGTKPVWLGPGWHAASVEGRPVTALEGFRGTGVRLETVVASANSYVEAWQAWSRSHGARPVLIPELLWVSQILPLRPDCLLLDLGGLRTRAYFQERTGSLRRVELPIGGHHFTRYLSFAAGVSPSRAERVKLSYGAGRLKPQSERKIRRVMQRAFGSWARRLIGALARTGQPLPHRWLCTGGGSPLPEMSLLPGLLAGDSILRLHRYPVLQTLAPDDACRRLVPGPEQLGPAHTVALTLADWWVRLDHEPQARQRVSRAAGLAVRAGFEVDADWLKL